MTDQIADFDAYLRRYGQKLAEVDRRLTIDDPQETPHPPRMTDTPSRSEIDAKLEAAEARTETRFVSLQGDMDRRFTDMRVDMDVRFTRLENKFDTLLRAAEGWGEEMRETRKAVVTENKSTRANLWIAAVGAVIAVVSAIYSIHSLNLATQANLLSAFQAKEAAAPKSDSPPSKAQQ